MSQRKAGNKSRNYTQPTLEETLEEAADPEEIADDVVRYIIYRAGEHMSISKAELTRNVIHKAGGKYEEIITRVRIILRKVYGYNLMVCDRTKGKDKQYVVSNRLPHVNDPSADPQVIPDDVNKILLLLVLSHIFMSNNMVSDVSLYSFLKSFDIDVELKHPLFGQVKEYITKTLVRKQYLVIEIDNISRRHTFKWGIRAEKEISKMAILKFVCKMYKGRQPKDWVQQHQVASEQSFENHLDDGTIAMEQQQSQSQ